jgi:sugar (pentulose or hexulose) kinase
MFLVVDCGTSFLKAALAEENGLITKDPVRFALSSPESPECWVSALEKAISHFGKSSIHCIAITGNGPSAVAVTKDGKAPVAVLWNSKGQNPSNPSFLPRIKALKEDHPDVYSQAEYILGTSEYLAYVLTKKVCRATPVEGFENFYTLDNSVDSRLIPPFMDSGSVLGCCDSIPVLVPWPDFVPAIIGSGAVHPGMLCLRTGTGDGINLCTEKPVHMDGFLTARHPNGVDWNLSYIVSGTGSEISKALGKPNLDQVAEAAFSKSAEVIKKLAAALPVDKIRVAGGLSDNDHLNSIRERITGMEIETMESVETGLQGLAILAYCALNKADIRSITDSVVRVKQRG